jgi:hypothetical protein
MSILENLLIRKNLKISLSSCENIYFNASSSRLLFTNSLVISSLEDSEERGRDTSPKARH